LKTLLLIHLEGAFFFVDHLFDHLTVALRSGLDSQAAQRRQGHGVGVGLRRGHGKPDQLVTAA
jgi:hypothetical protein